MRRRRKLILLAILLIPLGLAATATVLWLSRQSVAHYERRGDELAAAGKYEAAVRVYAVAAQKAERQNARMTKGLGRVVSRALMRIRGRQDLGTGPRDRHRQAELMTKLNRALQRTRSASLDEAFQKSDRSLVLMREAFKLDPAAPGFKRIIIRPRPAGDLMWAGASYASVHGPVSSQWRRTANELTLDVIIPANTAASRYRYGMDGLRKLMKQVLT